MIKFNEIFAYKRPYSSDSEKINGIKNFHYTFKSPSKKLILLEKGISNPAKINAIDGDRYPFISLLTTPNKFYSIDTPWADVLNIHDSSLIYFGDNKDKNRAAISSRGNKLLNNIYEIKDLTLIPPLLVFEKNTYNGKAKGHRSLLGYGHIYKVQKVIQQHPKYEYEYENFEFHIKLLNDNQEIDLNWDWIKDRYDDNKLNKDLVMNAPSNWINFITK